MVVTSAFLFCYTLKGVVLYVQQSIIFSQNVKRFFYILTYIWEL